RRPAPSVHTACPAADFLRLKPRLSRQSNEEAHMKAADVMSTRVITVPQDMPVRQVARILLDHRISAVPVVGLDGRVVGMISESDLIRRDSTARPGSWWLRLIAEPGDYNLAQDRVAADVMSRDVVS